MVLPARDDQYISLTPTDSPVEDAEMDAGEVPPDQAEQQKCFDTRTRFVGRPGCQIQ